MQTLTEEAPTLAGSGPISESQTVAEAYTWYRRMLKSGDRADRIAAADALVECGSSAVFPLLRTIEDDEDFLVARAALWSLLRLTDDMLGGKSEERDSPSAVLSRNRLTDPYLRCGLEGVVAQSTGGSAADTASAWTYYVDPRSRRAGVRFLTDMIRYAPDLDPRLPEVLKRLARRHVLLGIRVRGVKLLAEYEASRVKGELPSRARLAQSLAMRREAVGDADLQGLLIAATTDPDRTVRHIAGARLYQSVAKGAVVYTPGGMAFKDQEIRYLFP